MMRHIRIDDAAAVCKLGGGQQEASSGQSRVLGPITKAGNGHVGRLLVVEAAWHHNKTYRPSAALLRRWDAAGPAARVRGHQGNQRLRHRWEVFNQHKKKPAIACVAVARELVGWCWSSGTSPRRLHGVPPPLSGVP